MKLPHLLLVIFIGGLLTGCASTKSTESQNQQGLGIQPGFSTSGLSKKQILEHQAVFFDFDKTEIKPEYLPNIELHAAYLTEHSKQNVLLAGNTDVRGSREYNIALGEKRAQSVADVLMANGVLKKQIVTVSYGAEVPLACANDDDAYALNRRVDILYCQSSTCKQVAKHYGQIRCTYSQ
jgi:peptidoglycan-associated lipoprotein